MRGRPKLNRELTLKLFCELLQSKFPTNTTYTWQEVSSLGEMNRTGMMQFISKDKGYGKHTRLMHGLYRIPPDWQNNAPWMIKEETESNTDTMSHYVSERPQP